MISAPRGDRQPMTQFFKTLDAAAGFGAENAGESATCSRDASSSSGSTASSRDSRSRCTCTPGADKFYLVVSGQGADDRGRRNPGGRAGHRGLGAGRRAARRRRGARAHGAASGDRSTAPLAGAGRATRRSGRRAPRRAPRRSRWCRIRHASSSQPSPDPRSPAAPPRNPSSTAPAPDGVGSRSWLYSSANEPRVSGPQRRRAGQREREHRQNRDAGGEVDEAHRNARDQRPARHPPPVHQRPRIGRRSWCAAGDATRRAARHANTLATTTTRTHGQAFAAAVPSRGPATSPPGRRVPPDEPACGHDDHRPGGEHLQADGHEGRGRRDPAPEHAREPRRLAADPERRQRARGVTEGVDDERVAQRHPVAESLHDPLNAPRARQQIQSDEPETEQVRGKRRHARSAE